MRKEIPQRALTGKYVNLREVKSGDAAFILKLRTDVRKSRFIHETENDLQKQQQYLRNYFEKGNEWYFIYENKAGQPLGTVRLYDIKGTTATPGSWLAADEATLTEVMEGDILFKDVVFGPLGIELLRFDVRKANKSVVHYHKSWGCKIVEETDLDFIFELTKDEFYRRRAKMSARMEQMQGI